jgi:pyrimidine-nucleoside phosphorylase
LRFIDLIEKKKLGFSHSPEELRFIAESAASGAVPDYQLSAWLMAALWRKMDKDEIAEWTKAMAQSGEILDLKKIKSPKIDKHSTGGVGDGVSLVLAPLLAEAGMIIPMMSGRGLGHTGGTLDKLESIPGFRVRFSKSEIESQLKKIGVCLFGQNQNIAPADRKLYQLRDATSTVDSVPLIVSSILSKKMAEDLDGLVLDIKVGSGAIFKTAQEAESLAEALIETSRRLKLKAVAVLTRMEEPLGQAVGNALEVKQAVEVLSGDFSARDFVECTLSLGAWALKIARKARSVDEGREKLEKLLKNGQALRRMKQIIVCQGGDARVLNNPSLLPKAKKMILFKAAQSGFISRIDARKTGEAAVLLGAGRSRAEDQIDYGAGICFFKKTGDKVKSADAIAAFYARDEKKIKEALSRFKEGFLLSSNPTKEKPVVIKTLGA